MRLTLRLAATALSFLTPAFAAAQYYGGDPNALVDSWYRTFLGRPSDAGSAFWVNSLQQGNPPDAVLAGILASDEFYARNGGTPQGFIAALFNDLLQRQPNANDLNFWVGRMYTETRQDVALQIMTQNPGTWVGSGPAVPPAVGASVTVVPPIVGGLGALGALIQPRVWVRDRHEDWNRHHDIHDYRRPVAPIHRPEEHRDEHKKR